MDEIVRQLAIAFAVLLSGFAGPTVALSFLIWRKRRARKLRRSPIAQDLLRGPGHTLREQLDDATHDVMADVFVLMVVPLLGLAVFLAQGQFRGPQSTGRLASLYALLGVLFVAFMVRKLWKAGNRLDKLKAGLDAELAVGQELDQLMRRGAAVFHDVPAGRFNIDHVVIAAEGIFAIETKGFTKPNRGRGSADATIAFDGKAIRLPTHTTTDPLDQAERQAVWLSKWLTSAVGMPLVATPVLALPGWYVERKGRGTVRVFSGKELQGLLKSRGTQTLSAQDVQRVAHQVEQRCRTVAPKYSEGESPASTHLAAG